MKSLVKKIFNNNLIINIRNFFNIYPLHMNMNNILCASVSDSFLWRTDNGFQTKFRYSDILNTFFKIEDSWVEIEFYTKNNKLIKTEKIFNLDHSNEININKKYLNGIEDYGTFYIYHHTNEKFSKENVISNRCYLGYSHNANLYSFVHGNTLAKIKEINKKSEINYDIVKISPVKNQYYKIQKYFDNLDKNELFFSNPTSKKIHFTINNKDYSLASWCSLMIEIKEKKIIEFRSNCLFLRPLIFSYKNDFLDVHHG